jgi:phosphorylcholine metabolism protein LicD
VDWSDFFHRISLVIMHAGMPLVQSYQLVTSNVFLNVKAEDAQGIEKAADVILTPVHYLLAGKKAVKISESQAGEITYQLVQQYDYSSSFMLKTAASVAALPISLIIGCALKAVAFTLPETRSRHQAIVSSLKSTRICSNNDYYRSIGMQIKKYDELEKLEPPEYSRRPGDEKNMETDRAALKEIITILNAHNIPYWVDCGTCLGAYRYGGIIPWDFDIDIAVLEPDFENIKRALKELDPNKYVVQDWSGRTKPNTYLKVWIRETGVLVDIYHFRIDEESKQLQYIISNIDSIFLSKSWKDRERRYLTPVSFDTVFPLRKAQFDGIEVLVPNKTKKYLQSRYGENINPVKIYNEVTGQYERDLSHPYWLECTY